MQGLQAVWCCYHYLVCLESRQVPSCCSVQQGHYSVSSGLHFHSPGVGLVQHALPLVPVEGEVLNQVLHEFQSSEGVSIFVQRWGPQADAHGVGQDHHHGAGHAGLAWDTNLGNNLVKMLNAVLYTLKAKYPEYS